MESNELPVESKSLSALAELQIRKTSVAKLERAIGRNHRDVIRHIVQMCRLMESDDLFNVANYALSICKEMI